jgi:hypothetical protein
VKKFFGPVLLALGFAGSLSVAVPAAGASQSLTIKMVAENHSGENGTATLTQVADGVRVSVLLAHAPAGIAQPTHIHIGTCSNINKAPEYGLASTVDGKGDSTVRGVTLQQLLDGHYAVNVHKSGTELGTYASCGNIAQK